MGFTHCKADPCLFYKWTSLGIVIWVVIVEDCLGTGLPKELMALKQELRRIFDCDDQGEMREYIGCNVKYNLMHRLYEDSETCVDSELQG
jgi:hypothetical protein